MNCKKTWFGYLNSILTTLITGALIMIITWFLLAGGMQYGFNNGSDIIAFLTDPQVWWKLVISVLAPVAVFFIYFGIYRLRKLLSGKIKIFKSNRPAEFAGGLIGLAVFAAGLFLRIKYIIPEAVVSEEEKILANSIFLKETGINFLDFKSLYSGFVALFYRFLGVKPEIVVWIKFSLEILLILAVFEILRNVFNEIVCAPVMIYLCLINSVFLIDGARLMEYLVYSLLLLIFVECVKLFRFKSNSETIALVLFVLLGLIFVFFVPVMLSNGINGFTKISFGEGFNFFDTLIPAGKVNVILNVIIDCFVFIAGVSFFFEKKDNLSPVSFLWVIAILYSFLGKIDWPYPVTVNILYYALAGVGLYALLFSPVYEHAKEEIREKKTMVISKPETVEIEKEATGKAVEAAEKAIGEAEKTVGTTENAAETEPVKTVKLLDNPLPVPKAHVKKEINYAFEPEENNMHFDIDISLDDDFDV